MKTSPTQIERLLKDADAFAAIAEIQRAGTAEEIADEYKALVSHFYWKAHDLRAVVTIGRAGILYCLGHATERLRSTAKALAYDMGSFTWPGWEEPGIAPTPDDLAFGRDCATLNLRLAIELNKPADRLSMAHWLIGAHALANGGFESAEAQFRLAQEVLPPTDPAARSMEPLNAGYLAVAQLGRDHQNTAAAKQFDEIIDQLRAANTDDAKVYLTQLLSARKLFTASTAADDR